MSTPANETSSPSPRYQFNVEVCKGNITAGSIPTSIQVMTTIDGHIVNTTEGKPWPATWNEHITHYFHTLQPTTPVLISFSLYRRRFTTKSWKLVGSAHFSLHDFTKFINKGSFQQEFQVILNRKSLMTFSGTLHLKFEVIDRWDTSSSPAMAPDSTLINAKSCSGSTDSDDSHKMDIAPEAIAQSMKTPEITDNSNHGVEEDTPEDGHSTTKRPWTRRMSLFANSIFGASKTTAQDDRSHHGHHHHYHRGNQHHDHQHHDDLHLVDGTYSSDSDPEDHESQKRPTSANLTETKTVVASAATAAPGINTKNVYICPLSPSALSSFTVSATAVSSSITTTTTTTMTTNKDQQSPDDRCPPIVEKSSVTKTTYTTFSWFLHDWVLLPLEEIYRWETLFAVVVCLCVFLYWLNWRQVRHLDDSIDRIEARLYDMLQRPVK